MRLQLNFETNFIGEFLRSFISFCACSSELMLIELDFLDELMNDSEGEKICFHNGMN